MEVRTTALPLPVRLAFTTWLAAWLVIMLPEVGPKNFFWLCNAAKFLILASLWTGNRFLVSSQAGTVVLVGAGWSLDVLVGVFTGGSVTGLTAYMFDPEVALLLRLSSLYHVALPLLVLWMLWRLGYDRRAWWFQCVLGTLLVLGGWLFTEPWRNVNLVFQPELAGWAWISPGAWVALLLLVYPLVIYLPGHLLVAGLTRHQAAVSDDGG